MLFDRLRTLLISFGPVRIGIGSLFATVLIPGLLIGLLLCYGIYQNERVRIEQSALQTTRALLKAIDSELVKAEFTVLTLSKSEHLKTRNFSAFYSQARDDLKATEAGLHFVLTDLTGQQILHTAQPFGAALPQHGNPDHLNRVVQTGRPALSNLYPDPGSQRLLLSIDVPVVQNGQLAYILSFGLRPEYFSRLLHEQDLPAGWITAVLDAKNTLIARNLNPEKMLGQPATPDLQAEIRLKAAGTMASRSLEGTPTFIAFARSASSHWTLVVGMKRDVLYSSLYRLLAMVTLAFVALMLSGALLTWIFTRYVREALRALGAVTDAAARGDRNAMAPVSGLHEIDKLAGQFNQMQKSHKQMEEVVRELAYYDPLTRLANRLLLRDRLTQAMLAGKRSGHYGALLFMDLDNFKTLNDTQGHSVGDLLLIEVAQRLESLVRGVDTVARFGGDEFVVLLQELSRDKTTAQADAGMLAEKIRSLLAEPYVLHLTDEAAIEHRCTASIGAVLFLDMDLSEEDIVKQADLAMYQAKKDGRNLVRFYDLTVDARTA